MKKAGVYLIAILSVLKVTSCAQKQKLPLKSEASIPADGLSDEILNRIDDGPRTCLKNLMWSAAETFYEHDMRTQGRPGPGTQKAMANEARVSLAKSPAAVDGVEVTGEEESRRVLTVETTKTYDSPNGKAIDSFPKNLALLVEGKKGTWLFVTGYWSHECDYGWIPEKSVVTKSKEELKALGAFQR